MGYTTEFDGQITVDPPLNAAEVAYLRAFAATWHDRSDDPYYIDTASPEDRAPARLVNASASPASTQPGEHCAWTATDDGTGIEWNGDEKFYSATEWMQYLIDHFLSGTAGTFATDPRSTGFTFDHRCHGHIRAQGESFDDRWALAVTDNRVEVHALY